MHAANLHLVPLYIQLTDWEVFADNARLVMGEHVLDLRNKGPRYDREVVTNANSQVMTC